VLIPIHRGVDVAIGRAGFWGLAPFVRVCITFCMSLDIGLFANVFSRLAESRDVLIVFTHRQSACNLHISCCLCICVSLVIIFCLILIYTDLRVRSCCYALVLSVHTRILGFLGLGDPNS
jgi:hypothetical protein